MNNQQSIDLPKKIPLKILWFMFFSAIIIYNIVAIFIAQSQENFKGFVMPNNDFMPLLYYIFLAVLPINFFLLMNFRGKLDREQTPEGKQKLSIISFAFAEIMAIYGLILFVIAGDFNHLYLFSGLAIIAMVLVYPRQ